MASGRWRWCGDSSSMVGSSQTIVESATEVDLFRRYGEWRTVDKGVPIACDCGHAVIVQTETDALNKGHKFFSFPYGPREGCSFRMWWTQAVVEEFEVVRPEKTEMQKSLAEANERNQELEERIQAIEDDGTMEQRVIDTARTVSDLKAKFEDLTVKYQWLEGEYYDLRGIARSI